MKSVIGNNIIFSLFGESHSELMGITIHNLPSGLKIDEERNLMLVKGSVPGSKDGLVFICNAKKIKR